MKNKLILISSIVLLIIMTIISVDAIAPMPRVDLDNYQIICTDKNNVYISGTVSLCVGQNIGVYDATGKIMYNFSALPNSNKTESFKIQIPSRYLTSNTNTFKVKSTPIRGEINGSNPKTLTITIKTTTVKKKSNYYLQ